MFSLFICHPSVKTNCHRMPRTPSSTPPGSPGTPISDRSMSPQHQPATASPLNPLQNGVQQPATPPLSPRRAPSPRRPASPRGPRGHSPRGPPPPDPNLVDTSRPPPMRQPPAAQQVRGDKDAKDRLVLTLLPHHQQVAAQAQHQPPPQLSYHHGGGGGGPAHHGGPPPTIPPPGYPPQHINPAEDPLAAFEVIFSKTFPQITSSCYQAAMAKLDREKASRGRGTHSPPRAYRATRSRSRERYFFFIGPFSPKVQLFGLYFIKLLIMASSRYRDYREFSPRRRSPGLHRSPPRGPRTPR